MNSPRYRIGAFVGYNFWHESYDAFGCTQQATNWAICAPTVPTNVDLISQDNDLHSLRLGLAGQTQLTERLSLSGDVAFLFTRLDGKDRHHLRPKINPQPEDDDGHGVQLEAVLNYKVTDLFNIGVGARYWSVAIDGTAHFDETPAHGSPQVEDWEAERYGVFVQASNQVPMRVLLAFMPGAERRVSPQGVSMFALDYYSLWLGGLVPQRDRLGRLEVRYDP